MIAHRVKTHQPCPCGDSSDAYTNYIDHGYCFSCGQYFKGNGEVVEDEKNYTFAYREWRGISPSTFEFYGASTKIDPEGNPIEIAFAWPNGRTQVRSLEGKKFRTIGEKTKPGSLFGMDKFPAGSARYVTITEGAIDALSGLQMMGKYPFVSVTSASSARSECSEAFDYLNSFERIYLCFDNDEPGRKATSSVASIFDFNKIYEIKLNGRKDANEYLVEGDIEGFKKAWWAARKFLPEGVISSYSEIDQILDEKDIIATGTYPFPKLQAMTYGIRPGEVVLIKAPEKVGKTEFIRAIEYHLLKTTNHNIGAIHLEEGKSRMIKGLAGLELGMPVHLPDTSASKGDIKNAYRAATGRDDRFHLYTHFGSDDPDIILNNILFMAGPCECRFIFLDHLNQVVSGIEEEDERRKLDYLSTKLCNMVEDRDFTLFVISHVNDDGKTRGSRYIAKVADLIINLKRDITAEDFTERNTTYLTVEGNRFASSTGPAGKLFFDSSKFNLTEQLELPT